MPERIYLDHAATTPMDPAVISLIHSTMISQYGNPSSIHSEGRIAKTLIEKARKSMAKHLNCSIGELFFTSGATESNNMVLHGAIKNLGVNTVITALTEHHAILHALEPLIENGSIKVIYLPLDEKGNPSLEVLENLLQSEEKGKILVSLMHSNNETGTLIDCEKIGNLCETFGAYFHSDTVQSIGFYDIDLQKIKVHFISGSAHKFNGPKGVGFVYIKNDAIISPFLLGGSQERNMRGGTENLLGIVGMAKALEIAIETREHKMEYLFELKSKLFEGLNAITNQCEINGPSLTEGHPKILNVGFPSNPKSSMLLLNLDIAGISISGGSACSSGTDTGSHVLRAIDPENQNVNVRFSFSHLNTMQEIEKVIKVFSHLNMF